MLSDFLKKLIEAQSTPETGELAAAEVVTRHFAAAGIDAVIDNWDANRANVTAHIKSGSDKPALLFACHLDVVPPGQTQWLYPPFSAVQVDGKIYGRGSTDMKGGIAAIVTAITRLVDTGAHFPADVIFTAVAGEETDSCGAVRFVKEAANLPPLAGIILPEPTGFDIVTAHRGIFWLNVETKGKTAHGSSPELGINAITMMKKFLDRLESYSIPAPPHPLLGRSSMSINTIAGGKATNVVPDQCSLGIDIRTLPNQDTGGIIADFKNIFAQIRRDIPAFDADVSISRSAGALQTDPQSDFVKRLCSVTGIPSTKSVGFTTDGPHFAPLGVPVVIFGPGKTQICHRPDEFIELADIEKAVDYYTRIIMNVPA
jgi:succinyl-diaminopimelate desuccinylase